MISSLKTSLAIFSALLVFAGIIRADQAHDQMVAGLLKSASVFSQDEMGQTRFTGSFSSNYSQPMLEYALYNPCRDRGINGIVVTIQLEKDGDQGPAFDLFIPVECGPLQCCSNQQGVPVLKIEQAKRSPSVVLKEVHYTPLLKADGTSH